MKHKNSGLLHDQELKAHACVICDKKIVAGRLCDICSDEVDEKKEIIIRKDHPFMIFKNNHIH